VPALDTRTSREAARPFRRAIAVGNGRDGAAPAAAAAAAGSRVGPPRPAAGPRPAGDGDLSCAVHRAPATGGVGCLRQFGSCIGGRGSCGGACVGCGSERECTPPPRLQLASQVRGTTARPPQLLFTARAYVCRHLVSSGFVPALQKLGRNTGVAGRLRQEWRDAAGRPFASARAPPTEALSCTQGAQTIPHPIPANGSPKQCRRRGRCGPRRICTTP